MSKLLFDVLKNIITTLMLNKSFISEITTLDKSHLNNKDYRTRLAKKQEDLVIDYSNLFFKQFNDPKSYNYSSKVDLEFGDFCDDYNNYYDLKVGRESSQHSACTIQKPSIEHFGRRANHYYICANHDFSNVYLIDATKLYKEIIDKKITYNKSKFPNGEPYIGETDYSRLSAVVFHLEKVGNRVIQIS